MMIKLKSLITEAKISSNVERAAKKLGINFKKKVKTISTNKYSNPTGDASRMGKDIEKVKMDDWMDYDPKDPENQTHELVKLLQKKYKLLKVNKFASGASFIFTGNKNNPKSEFIINYTTGGIGGGYISYDGVKGQ
jgi:hypothetical protein